MVKADFSQLLAHLSYMGPHPGYEDGRWWQIAFDFGEVQISIARTPWTKGVELVMWDWHECRLLGPLTYVTPAVVWQVLKKVMERSAR